MEASRNLIATERETAIVCAVAATAVVRANVDQLKALRSNPGAIAGEPLPAAYVKHADDQTVAGLAAVLQAIHTHGLDHEDFSDWGVVAAPRFLARATLAQALKRFAVEGAWGVSPHLIPHRSLHSVSGTVSQALHIHGPNFGVGGGPHGAAKAMLAAAALLADPQLPGLWVIMTGWNQEPGLEHPRPPATNGHIAVTPMCTAVALALKAETIGWCGARLHIAPAAESDNGYVAGRPVELMSLESLVDVLAGASVAPNWWLACGGRMQFERQRNECSTAAARVQAQLVGHASLTTHQPEGQHL